MSSIDGSVMRDHVAPFSMKYAQRVSKIHEQRERNAKARENDVLASRASVGSTFRVSGADHSKNFSGDRTFGLVRPLSVGKSRGGDNSRSSSTERSRGVDGSFNCSDFQHTLTSFDKELQVQKDIAAIEKQKLALLQVKKDSYINYLKNKGNTPWIPGGSGAKHETSLHKSINHSAIEQRDVQRAWCRSPWPGLLPKDRSEEISSAVIARSESRDSSIYYDQSSSQFNRKSGNSMLDRALASYTPSVKNLNGSGVSSMNVQILRPNTSAVSPQRIRTLNSSSVASTAPNQPINTPSAPALGNRERALSASSTRDRTRSVSDSVSVTPSLGSASLGRPRSRGRSASSSTAANNNSKYVALTVRLIDAAHPAQKSAYGVFIVPRNCTRLDMISNIERQFNVPGRVSDISITYRSGYSHKVTVKSLSMGTIADIPEIDDYSSITIYLGGSTTFDGLGNITTHPSVAAATVSAVSSPAHYVSAVNSSTTVLPNKRFQRQALGEEVQDLDGSDLFDLAEADSPLSSKPSQPLSPIPIQQSTMSPKGLSAGDNLLFYEDDTDSVSSREDGEVEDEGVEESVYSKASRVSTTGSLNLFPRSSFAQDKPPPRSQPPLPSSSFSSQQQGFPRNLSKQKLQNIQPVQVPTYEMLHPEQPMHGFSFASPAAPLLSPTNATALSSRIRSGIPTVVAVSSADDEGLGRRMGMVGANGFRSVPAPVTSLPSSPSLMRQQDVSVKQASSPVRRYEIPGELYMVDGGASSLPPPSAAADAATAVSSPPYRRDWLAEAEARLKTQQQSNLTSGLQISVGTEFPTSNYSSVAGSPAYRSGTVSSMRRSRDYDQEQQSVNRSGVPTGRQPAASLSLRRVDSSRSIPFSRTRSRSADPVRGRSLSNSWESNSMQRRPSASPVSIRSTASSRARSAFINSRFGDACESQSARRRSNSVGRDNRSAHPMDHQHKSNEAVEKDYDDEHEDAQLRARMKEADVDVADGHHHGDHNIKAYQALMGGMGAFMPAGKLISRSSEERDYKDPYGGEVGIRAQEIRTPTPTTSMMLLGMNVEDFHNNNGDVRAVSENEVKVEGWSNQQRAPMPVMPTRYLPTAYTRNEYGYDSGQQAVPVGYSDVNSGGERGGEEIGGRDRTYSGSSAAGRSAGRQLSKNLADLLVEMS